MKNKNNIFLAFVITALIILGSIEKPIPTVATEETETIIQWKQEEVVEEVHIEEIKTETVTEPQVKFYDVPLSEELQLHIFKECEKYNIAPSIIIAMIERESNYKADAIGDNGNSLGLMQIQPRWNQERMDKLGCTDLLDPFQNTTVGIDLVAELVQENSDIYWVLMSYNGGRAYSTRNIENETYSEYAITVVGRASELEKAVEYGY